MNVTPEVASETEEVVTDAPVVEEMPEVAGDEEVAA